MADPVTFTVNGKSLQAPAGTLVIDACKRAGIEIPAFCYYEGLALQAACRMCLVEVEKAPKLLASCTLPVAEGMVVQTESPVVVQARKAMLEFLLTNHPLDCPVCDKGGECELQDMSFRYGAGESRFTEMKQHVDEKQWSPVVYFDAPRCILCYRCVRICDEGLGVKALGVTNRGVYSEITPNKGDHLDCDECGACIDICPVGALTSGIYRYQTRPWEMEHIGAICSHCGDGCKTTLGVKNDEILRGNNRDRSGINGEFLCIKGRYAFDFVSHAERLQSPMIRVDGKLEEVSWSKALAFVAQRFGEIKAAGGRFGVIGGERSTNEENYYLQKFARVGLGTPHIDHRRSGDVPALLDALHGRQGALATVDDLYNAKGVLIIGADLAQQHPLLAFQTRADSRHHQAKVFTVTEGPVREDKVAAKKLRAGPAGQLAVVKTLGEDLKAAGELVVLFGDSIQGAAVGELVSFIDSLGVPAKYICLVDYSNSRGTCDMGLLPHLGPGYQAAAQTGMGQAEMLADPALDALWVVGANPLAGAALASQQAFVVVQDMFLTETAQRADVVLPSASAYEKTGTVTNTCGQVQRLRKAISVMGVKADLDIFGLLARGMRLDLGRAVPDQVFEEIRASVHGYNVPLPVIATGGAAMTDPVHGRIPVAGQAQVIQSARDTLFTSGSLTRYSKTLNLVLEAPGELYKP
ncbi:MAG: NADH-quinone oxidoreductase subunit NuoG [Bryobacterales bacterium]|nr:NADH-quinone oxidoreductase subunit NuoG [Bryobacterales bacterium]